MATQIITIAAQGMPVPFPASGKLYNRIRIAANPANTGRVAISAGTAMLVSLAPGPMAAPGSPIVFETAVEETAALFASGNPGDSVTLTTFG